MSRFIRITLSLAAVIGLGYSIYCNRILQQLRQTHADLESQVGLLDVKDPTKVTIVRVSVSDDAIPPGVTDAHVWQYRMHVPANYGLAHSSRRGTISADSPRGSGGGGSSWGNSDPEPVETMLMISILKIDGKWTFCQTMGGGTSSGNLSEDFTLDSIDDLVVEPLAALGDDEKTFDVNEAICLLRIREKELAKDKRGRTTPDRFRGLAVYAYGSKQHDAFSAWADGKAKSMKEAQK